ncbi:MAG TPA: hypothetical protein HPP77_06685 [Candidatus Hydrogenedentes bacterium]|nr:hypothetical protein [Candidatus Hydrogenedentota bacterium]HIJ73939.1 hypothetical protein [Candidatus Hydrogenedentota bacterium]
MALSSDEMREIFERTEILRRPTYGIISGYHELPYVCLGASFEPDRQTTEVRGKVHVSPRFVIRPSHCEPRYEEIFGEENTDKGLTGRIFGFLGFRGRPIECKSEYIQVCHVSADVDHVLQGVLDELERKEDITTGVILTPNSRYYPVSIERFISSIVEDEFSV